MRFLRLVFFFVLLVAAAGLASGRENEPGAPASAPAESADGDGQLFAKVPVVEAATLHAQTLEEAPASVTVITAAEIRKYGYRTFGEALGSVRGFYFTNDRMYDYSGVRGLAIPGDFNSRFLVLLNGHPLTENIYNSNNFFGQDFGLDMDLVERIEIVRGPSSALYGSNGMLANINIVTKSPVDVPRIQVSGETGSFGEKKAIVSSSVDLGKGANLLLSTSVFNNSGRTLEFSGLDAPDTQSGTAHDVDAQKGYHTFANLTWGQWSFTGYFNSREIHVPVGGSGTVFDSRGNSVRDSRNFIGTSYTREVGNGARLHWQLHYDQYRYDDKWDYDLGGGQVEDNRTANWGDWMDTQASYSFPVAKVGTLTVGMQGSFELRNRQLNEDVAPAIRTLLDVSAPDRSGAIFAQQEWSPARHWTAYFGVRFDDSRNFGAFASPRLALVHQPSDKTSFKLVYGRPFRNPSAFERYYEDGIAYLANPRLVREAANALEATVERKVRSNLTAIVNAYDYRLRDVIQAVWIRDTVTEYQNAGGRRSTGVEFEIRGNPAWWLEATGSFVFQKASGDTSNQRLPNSPSRIGKARLAVPLVQNKIYLSGALQYLSARRTVAGLLVRPVALADITLSTNRLFRGYDLVTGIRNGLNWQYEQPVDLSVDKIRADGRTFFVKLIWQIGD